MLGVSMGELLVLVAAAAWAFGGCQEGRWQPTGRQRRQLCGSACLRLRLYATSAVSHAPHHQRTLPSVFVCLQAQTSCHELPGRQVRVQGTPHWLGVNFPHVQRSCHPVWSLGCVCGMPPLWQLSYALVICREALPPTGRPAVACHAPRPDPWTPGRAPRLNPLTPVPCPAPQPFDPSVHRTLNLDPCAVPHAWTLTPQAG